MTIPSDGSVGWSQKPIAASTMLDEIHHDNLPTVHGDSDDYSFGGIEKYNMVIASLPSETHGTSSAMFVATQLSRSSEDCAFACLWAWV